MLTLATGQQSPAWMSLIQIEQTSCQASNTQQYMMVANTHFFPEQ